LKIKTLSGSGRISATLPSVSGRIARTIKADERASRMPVMVVLGFFIESSLSQPGRVVKKILEVDFYEPSRRSP
jgi:hypothetical protein